MSVAIVGFFAVFHGHAHGSEIPDAASGLSYSMGFVLATLLLHMSGIAAGVLFRKIDKAQLMRYAGGVIVASGVYLLFV